MGSQEITTPLQSVARGGPQTAGWAIRWVHPEPDGPLTPLTAQRVVLGRGDNCRIRLDGEGVSRYHAELFVQADVFRVRDMDSTNGVHVNGLRTQESPLAQGDVLRLGDCVGVVVADRPAPAPDALRGFGEPAPGLLSGPVFNAVLDTLRAAAPTDLPVVVEGETGTGKERVARALHGWSGRRGAFVAINCAALPESLAEAELFGYRKGAFTGADRGSEGHFRAASGGTLLLDEVVDLPLTLQAKVLRAIEQREVVPLGETRPVPVDVRIVAAAQLPLETAVEQRRFRADLLARLDGLTCRLPTLRERLEEVPFLFRRLAARHGPMPALDPRLIERLCRHDWPFNVRELELLTRRLMALHAALPRLGPEHLPDRLRPSEAGGPGRPPSAVSTPAVTAPPPEGRSTPADDARDLAALMDALRRCAGNVTRAAALAGISRPRAYRLMRGHDDVDLEAIRARRPTE